MSIRIGSVLERVARGAVWLDSQDPNWVDAIDLEKLDIAQLFDCVVGQVFGDYVAALSERGLDPRDAILMGFEAPAFDRSRIKVLAIEDPENVIVKWTREMDPEYTFDRYMELIDKSYRALNKAWTDLILDRRAAAAKVVLEAEQACQLAVLDAQAS